MEIFSSCSCFFNRNNSSSSFPFGSLSLKLYCNPVLVSPSFHLKKWRKKKLSLYLTWIQDCTEGQNLFLRSLWASMTLFMMAVLSSFSCTFISAQNRGKELVRDIYSIFTIGANEGKLIFLRYLISSGKVTNNRMLLCSELIILLLSTHSKNQRKRWKVFSPARQKELLSHHKESPNKPQTSSVLLFTLHVVPSSNELGLIIPVSSYSIQNNPYPGGNRDLTVNEAKYAIIQVKIILFTHCCQQTEKQISPLLFAHGSPSGQEL